MAGFRIEGNTSGNVAEVNSANQLKVALETSAAANPGNVGAVRLMTENDDGSHTGTAYLRAPETSPDSRIRMGLDYRLFDDVFNYSAQNTSTWYYQFATLTASLPGAGFLQFSTVQGTTASHGAYMRTKQYFPMINTAPLAAEFYIGQATAQMVANEVFIAGFGAPSAAVTIPTDGVWFRLTSGGGFEGVLSYNSSVVTTQFDVAVPLTDFATGTMYKVTVVVGEREVEYWIDDVFIGHLDIPVTQGMPWLQGSLPIFMQKYNVGAVSNTNIMRVSRVGVTTLDVDLQRAWGQTQAIAGSACYQGQNGHTMGTTALLPNATGATTVTGAALAQATALATGLGGQAGITAAVPGVDGWVTAYLNPAATINITGRNLVITGVHISSINIGAAVATTPSTLQWSIAFGGTQLDSLATAEGGSFSTATVKAARRVAVGLQSWVVGAAIGAQAQELDQDFSAAPIVVAPGEYLGAVAKFIQGTATASQVIWAVVTFRGYFE